MGQLSDTDSNFKTHKMDFDELYAGRILSVQSDTFQPGDFLLDQFQVIKKLGEGGSAVVYLVKHQFTDHLFAVKVPKLSDGFDDIKQRMLMREIRTWLDLPRHPNLAACRFTRTLNGKFIVFAEFVDGLPLDELIRAGKISDLRAVLDIAIQIAWGLQAAHECGVIHRDIKPANILIEKDNTVRITDFGLARGFDHENEIDPKINVTPHSYNTLDSVGFMTPAYCSPEQALRQKLNHQTDIWSFGLTVFTMFTGRPIWNNGALAQKLFKEYPLSPEARTEAIELIPSVYATLSRCFQNNLEKRWDTMDAIAESLIEIYNHEHEEPYFRIKPTFRIPVSRHDLTDHQVIDTDDARSLQWLNRALSISGKSMNAGNEALLQRQRTRRSQILTGIERYEYAVELFQEAIANDQLELQKELALLLMEKSEQHSIMSDHSGQIEALNQSVDLLLDLTQDTPDPDMLCALADGYLRLGRAREFLRQLEDAVERFDQCIHVIEQIDSSLWTGEHARILARAWISKGTAILNLGDFSSAREMILKGLTIVESSQYPIPEDKLKDMLEIGYMNLASVAWSMNDTPTAINLYTTVIQLIRSNDDFEARIDSLYRLAMAKTNIGLCHYRNNDCQSALSYLENSLELIRKLVFEMDQDQFSSDFVLICSNLGSIYEASGNIEKALNILNEAITFHEDIIFNDGRNELLDQLALLYRNKASVLVKRGSRMIAFDLYDNALNIWNYLHLRNEGIHVLENATEAREWKCDALLMDLNIQDALEELRMASHNLEIMIFIFDRSDLKASYNRILLKRACLMDRLGNEAAAKKYLDIYQNKIQFCQNKQELTVKSPWIDQIVALLKKHGFPTDKKNEF